MRVAYIAAGAAGTICGSCLRDNALVAALQKLDCDAVLIPTYTPLRLDEEDVSLPRVFLGGVNVYLQQKFAFFNRIPAFLARALDHPAFLTRVASGNVPTEGRLLGDLAVSMLSGMEGRQARELVRLVDFLEKGIRPHLVNLSNILIAGAVPTIKRRLDIPIVVTLQGDDVFLDQLPANYRAKALARIREIVPLVDGFVVFNRHYGEQMSRLFHIPPERIFQVQLGLNTVGFPSSIAEPPAEPGVRRVGYLARVCREKGFELMVESFIRLKALPGMESVQLHTAGWVGRSDRALLERQRERIRRAGLDQSFQYHGVLDREAKVEFLQSLHVFSVPGGLMEAKGLYVLEALAAGVPVVEPDHGPFPELLGDTGGGVLCSPDDPAALAAAVAGLLAQPERRRALAEEGHRRVHRDRTAASMAEDTLQVYRRLLKGRAC